METDFYLTVLSIFDAVLAVTESRVELNDRVVVFGTRFAEVPARVASCVASECGSFPRGW